MNHIQCGRYRWTSGCLDVGDIFLHDFALKFEGLPRERL